MRLLLLRHALADPETAQLPHAERRALRRVLYRLRRLQKNLDAVACGAGPGAADTAKMVARSYSKSPVHSLAALSAGGAAEEALAWLRTQAGSAVIALVGEEPGLGRLAGLLTCGKPNRVLALQTRGICCIDCDGVPEPAGGMLRWQLTPGQLNRLKV